MSGRAAWATEAGLAKLREYWATDIPTAEIGRRLGASKCAIVSKAHRLGLPGKPSPIKRNGPGLSETPGAILQRSQAKGRQTPQPLSSPDAPIEPFPPPPAAPDAPRRKITAPDPLPTAPIRPFARVVPCCWVTAPASQGRLPLYCDTDSMNGLPYCPKHAKLAYPAVKQRLRENASMRGDD
jgi:GcrA cell cycle regulator